MPNRSALGWGGRLFNYQIPGRDSGGRPTPLNGEQQGGAVQENARQCIGVQAADGVGGLYCIADGVGGGRIGNGGNHSGGFEPSRGAGFPCVNTNSFDG